MKVIILPIAKNDMLRIGDYIAQDNPTRAISFMHELRKATEVLSVFPEAFPLVSGYEDTGIRLHVYRRYRIFFRVRVADNEVSVLRVLHGAQDYHQHL
ncbi:MAG: type II toxin-antitoxin system RelE/ParE family toxin [Propionibacteriaceae bacterium]|nr:type II toxin-antitoxin system RelE/ParE family toxin [Propionibacteriaceae bacterium]